MKIFDYDQKRALLVASPNSKMNASARSVNMVELPRLTEGVKSLEPKPGRLVADAADQIVKKDSRVRYRRIHFVPGDAAATAVRKVDRQHAFAGSRATT